MVGGGSIFEKGQENLVNETRCHKFTTLHEETRIHLTLSFISFKMEFNFFTTKYVAVSKQLLSTVNNIFKVTALTYFSVSKGTEQLIIRGVGSSDLGKFLQEGWKERSYI